MIGKIKDIIQKNRDICIWGIGAFILILAMVFMVKVDLNTKILEFTSHRSNQDEVQIVHDFTSEMEIRQRFECYENFDFITLSFSDHDQRLDGDVIIEIYELNSDKVLIAEERLVSSIYYNVPVKISFEDVGGGIRGKEYEIVLTSKNTGEVALGVFGYEAENTPAIIDNQVSEYSLSLGIHSYTNLYLKLTVLILGISSFSLLMVIIAVFKYKMKEEHIFLVIAVPFAVCMLLLWPGNAVYDEGRHVNTVYHYSNVILGCAEQDTMTEIQMRKCDVIDKQDLKSLGTTTNAQAQEYWYHIDKIWDKAEDKSMELVDISGSPVVSDGSNVQYIPGVLGMTLGRIMQLNYFGVMTLCRITIMGFYFTMCYYAIKKIPVLKMMTVFWAALPMNLYQTSGVSYDSFTFAVGIVVFAFIIKLWYEGLTKKEWIKLGLAVLALGQCKGGVYLTLILLMCLLPKERFVKQKWFKIFGVLCVAGVSMLSSFMSTIIGWFITPIVSDIEPVATEVINSGGVVAQKLHPFYVLQEPVEFIRLFVNTILENLDVYLGQMLGYRTAWSNEAMNLVIMLPFLVCLIWATVNTKDETFEIGVKERLGILIILAIEFIGMQAIFLVETPVYNNVIVGFQGRYFILFIPCILFLFKNNGLVFKGKKEYLYSSFAMAQMVYLYFFLKLFMCA